ncbi:MAG: ABC transporter ATP-binding protein [Planctomycetota bacterium]|jgi:lipoprotein-releasing system ATP-binding protein
MTQEHPQDEAADAGRPTDEPAVDGGRLDGISPAGESSALQAAPTTPRHVANTQARMASVPPDAMVHAEGVRKSFPVGERQLEVLHGVNLTVNRGETASLVGSSGAGKSTLLHILGLLEPPTEGLVALDGEDVWGLSTPDRAHFRNQKIGFVFQFYHLLPELTAVENVLLPAMIRHGRGAYRKRRKELRDRARDMLVRFGLEARLGHRPPQLSGGERQRVALARALFNEPPLVIADEPTGNLDRATGERILELLFAEQAERRFTLLLVTHDERLAARTERAFYMDDGIIESDSSVPLPQ